MTTPQAPLKSGFGSASTAHDVLKGIDLSGKVAIVTGGYSGIGLETTRAILSVGATVIVPARDREKAKVALGGLRGVESETLDLVDPNSINNFAERFLTSGRSLHILINNAGIMACPLTRDARGYEMQFVTNHLGHFQLTAKLLPALKKEQGARVVTLSSLGHRYSGMDFEDPNFTHRAYDRWVAYGQSKTANALFAVYLDSIGKAHGIRAFSVHPGRIKTDLARYMSSEELQKTGTIDASGEPIIDPSQNMKTTAQGAATSVWAATSPQLDGLGGVYCENCDIAPTVGSEKTAAGDASVSSGVRPWAMDPQAADSLWKLSEALTEITFQP